MKNRWNTYQIKETERKKYLNKIKRGDIFYADLGGVVGSEQSGIRPVIIVQNDIGNQHSATTIIVPLTKKNYVKLYQPTHYLLKKAGGIKFDSIVLTEQIRAVDSRRLKDKVGHLDSNVMKNIDSKLKIACGIEN